ncbi:MAG: hypothetical protein NVV74_11965 [Magnetospirillum sp.]|nr:hypothetical protein [Magnetospirillum sp.]
MLPWIITTLFLALLSDLAPEPLADTVRLFAIGYGALTVFVVTPAWAVLRLAQAVARPRPAPVRVMA